MGGFELIRQDRYLTLIALMVVVLNVVNTSGEYLFGKFVVEASVRMYGAGPDSLAARQQFVGGVYGHLYGYVNLVGVLLQLFAVSRILKRVGVGGALFIHPLVVLTGYVMMLKAPSVATMQWLKVFDNGIDYSLGNTAKHALWLPTSRVAKYKAKQAVDAFFMRAGDVLQAGIVFVGERLAFTVPMFAGLNVALALGWIAVVSLLNAAYRKQVGAVRTGDAAVTPAAAGSTSAWPPDRRLPLCGAVKAGVSSEGRICRREVSSPAVAIASLGLSIAVARKSLHRSAGANLRRYVTYPW